jgi:hypothetical protein
LRRRSLRTSNALTHDRQAQHSDQISSPYPHRPDGFGSVGPAEPRRLRARDVSRFCRANMNDGDMVVLACLKQNRARISKACQQVLASHGQ